MPAEQWDAGSWMRCETDRSDGRPRAIAPCWAIWHDWEIDFCRRLGRGLPRTSLARITNYGAIALQVAVGVLG